MPTVTALTPLTAFPDRVVVLQISGVGTHFGKDTVVKFSDPALHVTKVTAGSAGYLQAELHLDVSATLGPKDLTVSGPGYDPSGMPTGMMEQATLQGALRVLPSLQADGTGTTAMVTQGGLFDFSLLDLDHDTPLAGSGQLDGGARALYVSTLGSRLSGYGLIDALAAVGSLPLRAVYSKGGTAVTFVTDGSAAANPKVTARAAKALTAGTPLLGETLGVPRQTNLYKLTTTADAQVAVLSLATTGGLATNTITGAAAPTSGKWNDGQFFYASTNMAAQTALVFMASKGDQYLTVLAANLGGAADDGYDLTARVATAKAFSTKEGATPDTPAMPLATVMVDTPQHTSDGAIDSPTDIDYIRFQVAKAGRVYVQAVVPGQGLGTPAVMVAIMQGDCATLVATPRPVQQETTGAVGTDYCALLSASSYSGPYQLTLAQDL